MAQTGGAETGRLNEAMMCCVESSDNFLQRDKSMPSHPKYRV